MVLLFSGAGVRCPQVDVVAGRQSCGQQDMATPPWCRHPSIRSHPTPLTAAKYPTRRRGQITTCYQHRECAKSARPISSQRLQSISRIGHYYHKLQGESCVDCVVETKSASGLRHYKRNGASSRNRQSLPVDKYQPKNARFFWQDKRGKADHDGEVTPPH